MNQMGNVSPANATLILLVLLFIGCLVATAHSGGDGRLVGEVESTPRNNTAVTKHTLTDDLDESVGGGTNSSDDAVSGFCVKRTCPGIGTCWCCSTSTGLQHCFVIADECRADCRTDVENAGEDGRLVRGVETTPRNSTAATEHTLTDDLNKSVGGGTNSNDDVVSGFCVKRTCPGIGTCWCCATSTGPQHCSVIADECRADCRTDVENAGGDGRLVAEVESAPRNNTAVTKHTLTDDMNETVCGGTDGGDDAVSRFCVKRTCPGIGTCWCCATSTGLQQCSVIADECQEDCRTDV